jgi:hypothetical protein
MVHFGRGNPSWNYILIRLERIPREYLVQVLPKELERGTILNELET